MSNPHIALFTIPSPVHVNPTLPIVSTLLRRGYRVSYITSGRYNAEIATLGAEVLLCPRFEAPFGQGNSDPTQPLEMQHAKTLFDLAERTLSLVSPFYEKNKPNVVLYDTHSFAGPILAERMGVPSVRITSHLACDEGQWFRGAKIDEFFESQGVHRVDAIFTTAATTVCFFLRDLQAGLEGDDEGCLYAARCAPERQHAGIWRHRFPDGLRPPVLVSTSTAYVADAGHYQMCIEALSKLGQRGIFAVGTPMPTGLCDPCAAHVEIVHNTPLLALMPHVSLLVSQGGMATTMEALYHGLPQLLLTYNNPQLEMYAENLHKHAIGLHLRKGAMTIESVKEGILQLFEDEAVHESLREFQHLVKRSSGAEEVVNHLEDHLLRRHYRRDTRLPR